MNDYLLNDDCIVKAQFSFRVSYYIIAILFHSTETFRKSNAKIKTAASSFFALSKAIEHNFRKIKLEKIFKRFN